MKLTGSTVAVDLYLPQGVDKGPVVVVAHGFSRSRRNMAGLGGLLAANGFIPVVPDLLGWADPSRNARAIRELVALVQAGTLVRQPKPLDRTALVGFSMGGLSTLLATAGNTNVQCWIGLDPVEIGHHGTKAAEKLPIPCVVLRAEPATWNMHGHVRQIITNFSGPLLSLRVVGATHCDPENPTDWKGELACGKTDPAHRTVFERYTLAALRAVFLGYAGFEHPPSHHE